MPVGTVLPHRATDRPVGCSCSYKYILMLTLFLFLHMYPFNSRMYLFICTITGLHHCYMYTDPASYRYTSNQPFNDPAIMSAARLASPGLNQPQGVQDGFMASYPSVESFSSQHLAFGPPPGLGIQDQSQSSANLAAMSHALGYGANTGSGPSTNLEVSQTSGSVHGESLVFLSHGRKSLVRVPSAVLSVRKMYYRP